MQSYRNESAPSGSSSYGGGNAQAGPSNGLSGLVRSREDDIGKYKDKYEESMNPFEAFKGRVS